MFNLGTLGAAVTLDDSQYRESLQQLGEDTRSMLESSFDQASVAVDNSTMPQTVQQIGNQTRFILGSISGIAAAYVGFNS